MAAKIRIADRVQTDTCGHTIIKDMVALLHRNQIDDPDVISHITKITEQCVPCHSIISPSPNWIVSIGGLDRAINDAAFLDHVFLEQKTGVTCDRIHRPLLTWYTCTLRRGNLCD